MTKSFDIPKGLVWEAFQRVKANGGSAGVGQESIEEFEREIGDNLYRLWNRMGSGSYFPPAVKAVPIPKKSGGTRILGVPTVADRVAQTVVKKVLEPLLEPVFDRDSFGYRPGRSALDAVALVRRRSWEYDWVVEFDIKGLFDNIDHELLMRAVRKHCSVRFCRYADDGVVHCRSEVQAQLVLRKLKARLRECGLELHPEKTRIVYCQDVNRTAQYPTVKFTFLGYTFQPRKALDKYGRGYVNFSPAVSRDAMKAMRQTVRGWHLQLKCDKELADLSNMVNPVLRGWANYYGRFHRSALKRLWWHVNDYLVRWLQRKYKRLARGVTRAARALGRLAERAPRSFVHWERGFAPQAR